MLISIIIPVIDEFDIINDSVQRVREACRNSPYEIIIVDGDPSGSTIIEINDSAVRTALSKMGRGAQCNAGADMAKGEILLFLHADTKLPDNACGLILSALSEGEIAGGAFDLCFENRLFLYRIYERITSLRSRISRIPFGDQAIFLKRDVFYEVGRYADIPLMEDIELMRKLKKEKKKIRMIKQRVTTSTRKYDDDGIFYATLRNWILQILYYGGVSPDRLVKYYYRINRVQKK